MSDPLVGHVLDGRYEILGRLARGGMATVYRAQDRRLTRTVAVKVMHDGLGDDVEFSRKFDREARAAAILSNPHVVSVFDQGRDGGRPYIVMEFVEGFTLRHVISREGPLDPLRALDLLEPVVNALASAHEAGIVHRDVKPENVLISDRGHIKVADFGLARAVTAQTATATQGMLMGTVSYLPPELVTIGRTDSRGDVYSTGVVLFEMLTGKKPHSGDVPIQVAYMHVHNDIPAPSSQIAPGDERRPIPPYLDALVMACTRRNAAERPRDARQLLHLLRRARKAVAAGVADDPALTREMWASVAQAGAQNGVPPHSPQSPTEPMSDAELGSASAPAPARWTPPPPTLRPVLPVHQVANVSPRTPRSPRTASSPTTGPIGMRPGAQPTVSQGLRARRRKARRRRGFVILLVLTLLALGALFGVKAWRAAQVVSAPTLVNMTEVAAETALTANHLDGSFQSEYSETVPKGEVIRTEPGAGESVHKNSTVTAWLSLGPERHAVPTLVGLTQDAATQALTNAQLAVGSITQAYNETVKSGIVVSASQKAGALLKRNVTVDLTVSKGPKPITIPSWVGKSADQAGTALTKLGFKVTTTTANSDTIATGKVISQTPASGTGFKGDTITIVRSLGPVLVDVPDTRLRSEQSARAKLTAAGFAVNVQYATQSWLRLNIVSAQSPSGGKQPKGSTITIWVS